MKARPQSDPKDFAFIWVGARVFLSERKGGKGEPRLTALFDDDALKIKAGEERDATQIFLWTASR